MQAGRGILVVAEGRRRESTEPVDEVRIDESPHRAFAAQGRLEGIRETLAARPRRPGVDPDPGHGLTADAVIASRERVVA